MVRGGMLPPSSDKEGEVQRRVLQALREQPEATKPLIICSLNGNLDVPRTTQEDVLAAEMAGRGISCVSRHFRTRRRRRHRGRWTWRQQRRDGRGKQRVQHSKSDYLLARDVDCRRFRRCHWIPPPTYNSDHRVLVVK